MSSRCCPECGHELSGRSRFCLFCGCDLRKTRRSGPVLRQAGSADSRSPRDDGASVSSPFRKTAGLLLLVLVVAGLIVLSAGGLMNNRTQKPAFPVLHSGMSFSDAAAEMERCGFSAEGVPAEENGVRTQQYRNCVIYDEAARYVLLEVSEGDTGSVRLSSCFNDSGSSSERETALYRRLKAELSRRYGDPELKKAVYPYYYWQTDDGFCMMTATAGLIMITEKYGE